jgi:DNA sulfur modification protein DndD
VKYYFKKFASENINGKPDEYVWLLYFTYCSLVATLKGSENIWENLKASIRSFDFDRRTISKVKNGAAFIFRNLGASSSRSTCTSIPKLNSIQIKNFRGFGKEFNGDDQGVKINFHQYNTIFYGPNGSGKSSLCDALEYKLTGEVRECSRRSRKVSEYV